MEKFDRTKTIAGKFSFFTCKTGTGRDRACVKVHGKASNDEEVTVQCWMNWDGALPENLAAVSPETCYVVPETGLIRSIEGMLEGTVTVPAGTEVKTVAGRVHSFLQAEVADTDAFTVKRTNKKMVKFGA